MIDALATIAFDGARRQDFFRDELENCCCWRARRESIRSASRLVCRRGGIAAVHALAAIVASRSTTTLTAPSISGQRRRRDRQRRALHPGIWLDSGRAAEAPVRLLPGSESDLVSGLDRVHDLLEVQGKGVVFSGREPPAGPISIFELPTPGMPSKFYAGFNNFEVVTRYNRSTFYASAVLELAEAIRKAHGAAAARVELKPRSTIVTVVTSCLGP